MKKRMSVLLCLCLISGIGFAKPAKRSVKRAIPKAKVGRECCTQSVQIVVNGQVGFLSSTKCSGWFLSDSGQAMSNACQKALDALNNLLSHQQ